MCFRDTIKLQVSLLLESDWQITNHYMSTKTVICLYLSKLYYVKLQTDYDE